MKLFEKRFCRIVTINEVQFGFMHDKATIDAVFILRMLHGKWCVLKEKVFMCFVNLVKAFGSVLEWVVSNLRRPEVLVRSVMSLYDGAKISVRVESELSEEFVFEVGMHHGFGLSPFMQLW